MKTVRVFFSKTGRAKYISHLDLNRTMTRALRRAGIPLWYTEGFNRHPYITFAAPLSLGYEGLREVMDFRLDEDMPLTEITGRLSAVLPEGLQVTETVDAVMKAGDLRAAAYILYPACSIAAVTELLQKPEILVQKRTKKKEMKTVDTRPAFENAVVGEEDGGCCVRVTLPCGGENNVNPSLLIAALETALGEPVDCRTVRTALFGPDAAPFR